MFKTILGQKTIIWRLLSLSLVALFVVSCLGFPIKSYATVPIDDVSAVDGSVQQQIFKNQFDDIQSNEQLSDDNKVTQVIKLFFEQKVTNYIDDKSNAKLSFFLDDNQNNRYNVNKINNYLGLQKRLRQNNKSIILLDELNVSINSISVTDQAAVVSIYESFSFHYEDVEMPSSTGIEYTINLSKIDDSWLITSLDTNDETYSDEMGQDSYDVEKVIANVNISNSGIADSSIEEINAPKSTRAITSYRKALAADYAYKYTNSSGGNSTTNYNLSQFNTYNPNDCQNFASQAVWAGFGGTKTSTSTYFLPMFANWYSKKSSTVTNSWVNVGSFWSLGGSGTPRMTSVKYTSGVANADSGDLVQIYSSASGWYHVYVVNSVTGTNGSRTPNNLFVCAHTANRQNQKLGDIWTGTTRTYHPTGIYY